MQPVEGADELDEAFAPLRVRRDTEVAAAEAEALEAERRAALDAQEAAERAEAMYVMPAAVMTSWLPSRLMTAPPSCGASRLRERSSRTHCISLALIHI